MMCNAKDSQWEFDVSNTCFSLLKNRSNRNTTFLSENLGIKLNNLNNSFCWAYSPLRLVSTSDHYSDHKTAIYYIMIPIYTHLYINRSIIISVKFQFQNIYQMKYRFRPNIGNNASGRTYNRPIWMGTTISFNIVLCPMTHRLVRNISVLHLKIR